MEGAGAFLKTGRGPLGIDRGPNVPKLWAPTFFEAFEEAKTRAGGRTQTPRVNGCPPFPLDHLRQQGRTLLIIVVFSRISGILHTMKGTLFTLFIFGPLLTERGGSQGPFKGEK